MPRRIALIAGCGLLLPTAALAVAADAAGSATGAKIVNCEKTTKPEGVKVRIKLRVEQRFIRVRVSHPRGEGNFTEPRVQRVALIAFQEGPMSRSRGMQFGDRPVYRLQHANAVDVKFTLRNGRTVSLFCMYPTSFPPCPTPEPGSEGQVC